GEFHGHASRLRRPRSKARRTRRLSATVLPVLPHPMERISPFHRSQTVFPAHAPRGRPVVGPRIRTRARLGARLLLPGSARGDRARRPIRPTLLPLLRGSRPLPRGTSGGLERDLLSLYTGRTHRRRKRRNRGAADPCGPANFGASDPE